MTEIGKQNKLRVVKEVEFGFYLDGGGFGEILLPRRYVPKECKVDDIVKVFVYRDSEDRIIATTEIPYAMVGDFALLKVVSVNRIGAFLDWGLTKDLLLPCGEQNTVMEEGQSYIVRVYVDKRTNRIAASSRLDKFLDKQPPHFQVGWEVDLFICNRTDIGYKAVINGSYWGVLHNRDVYQPLGKGEKMKGFIKKIREDYKIDLSLHKPGYEKVNDITKLIITTLKKRGGFLSVTDKSPPEEIYQLFGVSKKTYKKAIGAIYKKRLIMIENKGITLIE
ncbi:MAG: GntR family transcriptional regulator [Candidatus Scalindua sp. AMX11]|nr:MAG: GntR family transcriptional regulator [Candidatus Scalindua sp.]NOG84004.1 GntR family transcriptional regulator [Planctomycetota bacterium]RZV88111.1 MAG: GntR family transcriptional regulator [Candidatus Scalindua sp. SCAELEC01]TDE64042.1 MAG: GntR family transcriptional regulator [Candidatus Scalindua sp. AMX11]